jgi:di/tricarboxylate transporter
MFILSAGLYRSGAVNAIGNGLARLGRRSFWLTITAMMLVIGGISAFINNTAAVAIFIPIVVGVARGTRISVSRFLMPLSFASMFGGVCTLIGTSTNILVSSMVERIGLRPLGMFEMAGMGLVFFTAGILYMLLIGLRLLPARTDQEAAAQQLAPDEYLTEIVMLPDARSVGAVVSQSPLVRDLELRVVEIFRDGRRLDGSHDQLSLQPGDHLKVRCSLENFRRLQQRRGIILKHAPDPHGVGRKGEDAHLVEAVIAPSSALDGRSLSAAHFRSRYGFTAIAIRHREHVMRDNLEAIRLRAGDVLLFELDPVELARLRQERIFVLASEVPLPVFRKRKITVALAIVTAVVAAAALGIMPIMSGAIAGCILMVLAGCLSLEEAYRAVEWQVIMLMAGVLTLGVAMESSGAAVLLSKGFVSAMGGAGPMVMVAVFYLITMLLTAVLSNNATVALLIPIVFAAAKTLGVEPKPLVMAVTFAASLDFMTPFGYQTNTLVYGPGRYRFVDYLRVGAPLNLLFWILATIFIPRFWTF